MKPGANHNQASNWTLLASRPFWRRYQKGKYMKVLAILLAMMLLSSCATLDTLTDPVSPSRRANISGTITTGPMRSMPSLISRGIKKVGLVLDLSEQSDVTKVGLTAFQNKSYQNRAFEIIATSAVVDTFLKYFQNGSELDAIDLSSFKQEILNSLKVSDWNGKGKIDISTLSEELLEYKVDAYLLIDEVDLPDYIGHTNQRIGTKGIYHRLGKTHVFGGFRVRLIDARNGKELKKSSYIQTTSRSLGELAWKEKGSLFSPGEIQKIREQVQIIYDVNVEESLIMLNAIEKK